MDTLSFIAEKVGSDVLLAQATDIFEATIGRFRTSRAIEASFDRDSIRIKTCIPSNVAGGMLSCIVLVSVGTIELHVFGIMRYIANEPNKPNLTREIGEIFREGVLEARKLGQRRAQGEKDAKFEW